MARKFLCADIEGLCCEGCYEALETGIIDGDELSLLPEDRVVTFTGYCKVKPGRMTCGLCGTEGELDVCFGFMLNTIEEFGKFGV